MKVEQFNSFFDRFVDLSARYSEFEKELKSSYNYMISEMGLISHRKKDNKLLAALNIAIRQVRTIIVNSKHSYNTVVLAFERMLKNSRETGSEMLEIFMSDGAGSYTGNLTYSGYKYNNQHLSFAVNGIVQKIEIKPIILKREVMSITAEYIKKYKDAVDDAVSFEKELDKLKLYLEGK